MISLALYLLPDKMLSKIIVTKYWYNIKDLALVLDYLLISAGFLIWVYW